MKKLFKFIYLGLLNFLLDSQNATIRFQLTFGYPENFTHKKLQLREKYFEFVFEFYKGLLPKKWVNQFEKEINNV